MSRELSAAAVRAMLAQETDVVFLELLTITHPDISPIYVVNNLENVTSRGKVYVAFPFQLQLPQDLAEQLVSVPIRFSNVDRRLVEAIRTVEGPLTVTIEVVTSETPDVVEGGPLECELTEVGGNEETLTATLGFEPILSMPFPAGKFDPQRFPGIFGKTQ